jgi:hypothetical protein
MRKFAALLLITFGACVAYLLCFPLPRTMVTAIVLNSSDWILTEKQSDVGALRRAGHKFVRLLVQQNIASQLYDGQPLPAGLTDVERMSRRLARLKQKLIVQTEIMHAPTDAPPALAGLAWCDSLNNVAATILANDFDKAEIVGVYEKSRGLSHSFGRVWSRDYGDWLYFDAWPDEVVIFRSEVNKPAQYLARFRPISTRPSPPEETALIDLFHDHAATGRVHNQLQSTLIGYLANRVGHYVAHGTTAPLSAKKLFAEIAKSPTELKFVFPYRDQTDAKRTYLEARLHDLYGESPEARAGYAKVVAMESGNPSVFGAASALFAARIDARFKIGGKKP